MANEACLLDLRTDPDRAAFHKLVEKADVVFSNLRGDGAGRLGLRYADLRQLNQRIVCRSLGVRERLSPRDRGWVRLQSKASPVGKA